jgi:hypothetical protein
LLHIASKEQLTSERICFAFVSGIALIFAATIIVAAAVAAAAVVVGIGIWLVLLVHAIVIIVLRIVNYIVVVITLALCRLRIAAIGFLAAAVVCFWFVFRFIAIMSSVGAQCSGKLVLFALELIAVSIQLIGA